MGTAAQETGVDAMTKEASLMGIKPKTRVILEDAIDRGIERGLRRAYNTPTPQAITTSLSRSRLQFGVISTKCLSLMR